MLDLCVLDPVEADSSSSFATAPTLHRPQGQFNVIELLSDHQSQQVRLEPILGTNRSIDMMPNSLYAVRKGLSVAVVQTCNGDCPIRGRILCQ
jgi:hypothetical protein